MSDVDCKAALEARLIAMPQGIPQDQTEFPNDRVLEPTEGVPYQRTHLLPLEPHDYGYLSANVRFAGVFQIDLHFPFGDGSGEVDAHAKALAAWFRKGWTGTANNVTTCVGRTPQIRAGRREGDRWVVPVRVTYFANI